MDTPISIHADLQSEFERLAAQRGEAVDAVVDVALRAGLRAIRDESPCDSFPVRSFNMGEPLCDVTKANQLADHLALSDEVALIQRLDGVEAD
ncbi:hypothetical protein Pla175_01770 [Pirellulimonas nuda]|uniref:Uncharacterized protein n=1 Tax=Pirellulimonas nuda TaxID=2528009 RepID=A0A518D5T1_9BACT|nr:hypothetical protein [Pirellulimonas nuda]QDU86824.1 hypothetical protein Pla175_01770 [Pirellulimonas nuda]